MQGCSNIVVVTNSVGDLYGRVHDTVLLSTPPISKKVNASINLHSQHRVFKYLSTIA